jgi:hypothetical protein
MNRGAASVNQFTQAAPRSSAINDHGLVETDYAVKIRILGPWVPSCFETAREITPSHQRQVRESLEVSFFSTIL